MRPQGRVLPRRPQVVAAQAAPGRLPHNAFWPSTIISEHWPKQSLVAVILAGGVVGTHRHLAVSSLDHTSLPRAPTLLCLSRSQGLPLLVIEGRVLRMPVSNLLPLKHMLRQSLPHERGEPKTAGWALPVKSIIANLSSTEPSEGTGHRPVRPRKSITVMPPSKMLPPRRRHNIPPGMRVSIVAMRALEGRNPTPSRQRIVTKPWLAQSPDARPRRRRSLSNLTWHLRDISRSSGAGIGARRSTPPQSRKSPVGSSSTGATT
mmetsp:Transcript_42212/g.100614  ORF Transcript_42212/g.100614 Transcript_42212/m.100614 type:complete len:262 (-) Transcript_42212:366-1151(-)